MAISEQPNPMARLRMALLALMLLAQSVQAFDLQGHRGARGLAPENTLAAFARALQIGVTTLELDVGVTSDGVVVVAHDRALNPELTRDANGRWLDAPGPAIHALSYAELQSYDVGRAKPGSRTAQRYPQQQPADGDYAIRVYQMRAAARRKESASYTLEVSVTGTPASASSPAVRENEAGAQTPFDQTLELLGITFRVSSPNAATGNTVEVTPTGLAIDNRAMSRDIDGVVTGVDVADLNVDGSPEIYVYVRGAGPAKRASLVAYSANNNKSLSEIYLPPLEGGANAEGYQGHDEMAVVETVLARRFPIYGGGETATPTGRTRQLQYKLKPGEAGCSRSIA